VDLLVVVGSLRRDSWNGALARAATEVAPAPLRLTVFDGLEAVEPFNEDREPGDHLPGVVAWRRAVRSSDGVLFVTPEYNSSVPGQLKNAIDWGSRPEGDCVLWNRPAIVIGASTGAYGATWAQAELRKALAKAGARVLPHELAVARAHERFDDAGGLVSGALRRRLIALMAALAHDLAGARAPGVAS